MTIEQLAEMRITEAESIAVYADLLKRSVARLESLRALAVDTVVPHDQEKAKRDLLACWREQADAVAVAVDLLDRGPMRADEFGEEVRRMLDNPTCNAALGMCHNTKQETLVREWFAERANNIAAAYAGRVAREPR